MGTTPSSALVELMQGHGQGRWRQPSGLPEQVRPNLLRPDWHRCLGYRMWRGQHSWCLRLCVQGCLLDRLRHVLQVRPGERILLKLLGLLGSAVPDLDGRRLTRLSQEVADMQNAGSLTGRKKAAALAKGVKAQETLNKYAQCNVFWQPIDAAPLTTGGNGYVDGGDIDISGFERKGPNVAQPSDSSAVKLTQGSSY